MVLLQDCRYKMRCDDFWWHQHGRHCYVIRRTTWFLRRAFSARLDSTRLDSAALRPLPLYRAHKRRPDTKRRPSGCRELWPPTTTTNAYARGRSTRTLYIHDTNTYYNIFQIRFIFLVDLQLLTKSYQCRQYKQKTLANFRMNSRLTTARHFVLGLNTFLRNS